MNKKDYEEFIIKSVNNLGYEVLGIVQHGSTVMGVAEENSDIDFITLVNKVVNKKYKELPIITSEGFKIHVTLFDKNTYELLLKDFYTEIAMKLLDVNLLAGRIIHGDIIYDPLNLIEESIKIYNLNKCPKYIIEKFVWQCFNFINDAKHSNKYIKQNCIEKAIDSWGIAILLSNSIYTLNIKWQPILLEKYLPPNIYDSYIKLRFNYNEKYINKHLKILMDFIRRELDAYQSSNTFH
ncbi:nucleotidyltransferase domain-containing protein [Lysinibacillus sp. NPDC096418]|uniref:nucleotidyltransferase domain-containing protein n=1 Tax=Lysinibacillus sp. NPDC096418 TaxID=3364138 RepID=UPI00381E7FEA